MMRSTPLYGKVPDPRTVLFQFEPCDLVLAPAALSVQGNPLDVRFRATFRGPQIGRAHV